MPTTVGLANTSIMSHNFHFFFVVRLFKIYSLSNFHVHNTVLLTIITMLYIRFPELIHLTAGSWYSDQHLPFPPPPDPGNHHSSLCFYEFMKPSFLCLASFLTHPACLTPSQVPLLNNPSINCFHENFSDMISRDLGPKHWSRNTCQRWDHTDQGKATLHYTEELSFHGDTEAWTGFHRWRWGGGETLHRGLHEEGPRGRSV